MKTAIAILLLCTIGFAAGKKPLIVTNDLSPTIFTYSNFTVNIPPQLGGSNWMIDGTKIHSAGGVCFWSKWQVDTNQNSRTSPLTSWTERALEPELYATNVMWTSMTNRVVYWGQPESGAEPVVIDGQIVWRTKCNKEHWDGEPHEDITYAQSNLMSFVAFRGVTNIQRLESICISTNVRKWHWEKKKIYEDEL